MTKKFLFSLDVPSFVASILVFLICILILFVGENVGLSDNGDFGRIMSTTGISFRQEGDAKFIFTKRYEMQVNGDNLLQNASSILSKNNQEMYKSPHLDIIVLSKLLNLFYNSIIKSELNQYHIAGLCLIYITLLCFASYLIIKFFKRYGLKTQIFVFLLFIFIFCDSGYLLYFNSFYGEALQFVTIFLLIGLTLTIYETENPILPLILFFIANYYFGGSKLVNIPYAVLIALTSLVFWPKLKGIFFRVILISCVIINICALGYLYTNIPSWMEKDTNYQAVFFGILKDSPTPEKDLETLGLAKEYSVLQNTHAYLSEYDIDITSDTFREEFFEKISKIDIALFYFKNPARLYKKTDIAIKNSAYIRPPYLANTESPRMTLTNKWSAWGNLRVFTKILYNTPIVIILMCSMVFLLIYMFIKYRNKLGAIVWVGTLLAGCFYSMMVPVIANGEADIAKHMFLFVNLMDIMFMGLLIIGFILMPKSRKIKGAVFSIICMVICLSLLIPHLFMPDTIIFGSYKNQPIIWEILTKNSDGSMELISKHVIDIKEFNQKGEFGSNLWKHSSLREFLNEAFLEDFTQAEKTKILYVNQDVLLASTYRDNKTGGEHPHYYTYEPSGVAFLSESAYHDATTDLVYLPSLFKYQDYKLYERPGKSYWLLDPYAGNASMMRYANKDGFVLFKDANESSGVRPLITIKY